MLESQPVGRIYELLRAACRSDPPHAPPAAAHAQARPGKIVKNASIIGHAPFPGATVYAAAKTGLHGFTESLRRELEKTPLTVLELITPGVDTEMMEQVQAQLEPHVNTDGWDHVDPDDWAQNVVEAIRSDTDELNPSGAERIAKLLPKALLDLTARKTFERS